MDTERDRGREKQRGGGIRSGNEGAYVLVVILIILVGLSFFAQRSFVTTLRDRRRKIYLPSNDNNDCGVYLSSVRLKSTARRGGGGGQAMTIVAQVSSIACLPAWMAAEDCLTT